MSSPPSPQDTRTKLSEDTYQRCLQATLGYLAKNEFIRNRDIREVTGIGYDQAITFFGRAVSEKRLSRRGSGSSTHYIPRMQKGVR